MAKEKGEIDFLIKMGFTENEAKYIQQHPCLENYENTCESRKTENGCAGCTNLNGFLMAITEPNGKPKPVKYAMDILEKKGNAVIFEEVRK
jgi:hypothetical protein